MSARLFRVAQVVVRVGDPVHRAGLFVPVGGPLGDAQAVAVTVECLGRSPGGAQRQPQVIEHHGFAAAVVHPLEHGERLSLVLQRLVVLATLAQQGADIGERLAQLILIAEFAQQVDGPPVVVQRLVMVAEAGRAAGTAAAGRMAGSPTRA